MKEIAPWILAAIIIGWMLIMQGCTQAPVYRLQDISCSWLRPIELSEQATSEPLTDNEILTLFADHNLDGMSEDMLRIAHELEYKHSLTLEDLAEINTFNDAVVKNCPGWIER